MQLHQNYPLNPDNIYLGGIIDGITNMSSITDEVYVVNNDRSIQMQFDVTIGAAMHIAHVSDFTCYFQGVHVPATRIQSNGLDISGEQSGTLPATTGSNTVPLIIDFANAFDSTDKNITTFESFEPILYYNRNWLFSFGDYDARVTVMGEIDGLTSYNNKSKAYVWGEAINTGKPKIKINNVETTVSESHANPTEIILDGDYDIYLGYAFGTG